MEALKFDVDEARERVEIISKALSPSDWEDLTQDALLKAWRFRSRFDGSNLGAWLRTVVRSVHIQRLRYQSRRLDCARLDEVRQVGRCDDVLADVFSEEVEAALRSIPDHYRAAVLLVDVQGMSYDDAAAVLGVPVGTVRSRVSRGREALRRLLS